MQRKTMNIRQSIFVAVAALAAGSAGGCRAKVVVNEPVETAPPPASPDCSAADLANFTGVFGTRSPTEAPSMAPEGGMVCGNVPEGGKVQGNVFMLDPGKCYTVIANGLPNITEIDVALMIDASAAGLPPNIVEMAKSPVAVDSETGPMGTIGPKSNCYRWNLPIPAPVRVVVTAKNGAGPIAAQVFSRK